MKVIGLCGGSGSGKGTVCELFKSFDLPSIDTDAIYRQLTSAPGTCMNALEAEFGETIVGPDGGLDRVALRKIVFEGEGCKERLAMLNRITHKFILDRVDEILFEYKSLGKKGAIVDAPLLFESGYDKKCDVLLAVTANENIRIDRIVKRDKISSEDAKKRMKTQISDEKLIELCDFYIVNNGDFSELEIQVRKIAEQILYFEREKTNE